VVLIGDPKIAAIPVQECGEGFADFSGSRKIIVDESRRWITSQSVHFAKARISVVRKIIAASLTLPSEVYLKVIEAYRPMNIQQFEFDRQRSEIRARNQTLSDNELSLAASRFSAPPTVAPHPTGAAVDLTLCDVNGNELDMGTAPNATTTESNATYTNSNEINAAASERRALLVAALTGQGLVNYPSEWWHWSYGDRYWAFITGSAAAIYSQREEAQVN
jgi:zinc D-Ala-D-Ala dipeptidase